MFGDTYHRAQAANSKEEFFKSKEAASAAAAWSSSLIGSAVQSYGVGALINATGTLSYKGAAYLGSLIFFASAAPGVSILFMHFSNCVGSWVISKQSKGCGGRYISGWLTLVDLQFISQVVTERRPMDTIAVGALTRVLETVGLSLFLTWWGTRTNPFD